MRGTTHSIGDVEPSGPPNSTARIDDGSRGTDAHLAAKREEPGQRESEEIEG
jgi:hypothetical protein